MKTIHQKEYKKLLDGLIAARRNAGITQQELAKMLEKPQSYVSKYESAERRLDVIEFLAITECLKADYIKIIDTVLGYMRNTK